MPRIIATPIAKLWNARKRQGLTQTQVAAALDPPVAQNTYSAWESGTATLPKHRAAQLEALLGIKLPKTATQPRAKSRG